MKKEKRKKKKGAFCWAWAGIVRTVKCERNMRVHLTAVVYVTAMGFLAKLDGPRWAAVLLCFGAVIAAELFNTALENLCDAVHPDEHPQIGFAKDAAAGAVLVAAIAAVGVAVAIFGPWIWSGGLLSALKGNEVLLPVFLLSVIPAILWIRGKKTWKLKNRE